MIYKNLLFFAAIFTCSSSYTFFGWLKGENKASDYNQKPETEILQNLPKDLKQAQVLFAPINVTTYTQQSADLKSDMEHFSFMQTCKDWTGQTAETLKSQGKFITTWILQNKKKSTLIAFGATFLGTQAYLFYLTNKLKSPNCWSLWRTHLTLKELYSQPQEILAQEILRDVQKAYTTIKNPTDFVTPLIAFLNDTYYEERYLLNYSRIIRSCQKIYLNKILFYDQNLFNSINQRLAKLEYLKITFLTWLANYKISTSRFDLPKKLKATLRKYKTIKA